MRWVDDLQDGLVGGKRPLLRLSRLSLRNCLRHITRRLRCTWLLLLLLLLPLLLCLLLLLLWLAHLVLSGLVLWLGGGAGGYLH